MVIQRRFNVSAGLDTLLAAGAGGSTSAALSPACEKAARRALEAGRVSLDGKAFSESYLLEGWGDERESLILRREGGAEREFLRIGAKAEYLAGACMVVAALCTVGDGIESVSQREESTLVRYYLNAFGVKALEALRHAAQEEIAARARSRGWGVSPSLSPGSLQGWPVEGQRDLFRLAGGERTGMGINDAALLSPAMSMSFLVGMGPECASQCVGALCSECPRSKSCEWRQRDSL